MLTWSCTFSALFRFGHAADCGHSGLLIAAMMASAAWRPGLALPRRSASVAKSASKRKTRKAAQQRLKRSSSALRNSSNGSFRFPPKVKRSLLNSLSAFLAQYGEKIFSRVNLGSGRVKPNVSLGAAMGAELHRKESRTLNLQVEEANLTYQVNVLNFAGLFSGTAVGAPRSASIRLRLTFSSDQSGLSL